MSNTRARLSDADPFPPECDRSPVGASEHLFRTELPGLLKFLRRITTPDRAQDAVQQVFARLLSGDAPPMPLAPRAYLRKAAANAVRDGARSAARARSAHGQLTGDLTSAVTDPVAVLEQRDQLRRIEAAVRGLKPLTRQVFLARRVDGYSYAEIAARTGLSERGVEKQMRIALGHLGKHLRQHG